MTTLSDEDWAVYKRMCPTEYRLWARVYRRLRGKWPHRVSQERLAWADATLAGRLRPVL